MKMLLGVQEQQRLNATSQLTRTAEACKKNGVASHGVHTKGYVGRAWPHRSVRKRGHAQTHILTCSTGMMYRFEAGTQNRLRFVPRQIAQHFVGVGPHGSANPYKWLRAKERRQRQDSSRLTWSMRQVRHDVRVSHRSRRPWGLRKCCCCVAMENSKGTAGDGGAPRTTSARNTKGGDVTKVFGNASSA